MPNRYEAILFDFDGVLVDSEPLHFECWNQVLVPFGLSITWDDYVRTCIGVADQAMVRQLCELTGRSDLFDQVWARYPDKQAQFRKRMMEELRMPPQTLEMLRSISGCQLAVVSSSSRTEVEPPLVAAGARDCLHAIICREDVSQLKPSPEPYLTAAARLGVQRALVVEDSEAGLASGRAAGFDVVRIPSPEQTAALVMAILSV
ncbi:MAG: HAD family phosphatase [Acidobacteriia bacterium]|nr:HAD family phosphatase [Terriglobia bacterium]